VRGKQAKKLAEAEPCRREAAAAELLQRQLVHLLRSRTRGGARRARRLDARHGLTRLFIQATPVLAQALLRLAVQLLHREQLLLHTQQVRAHVTPQLNEVALLGGEGTLQRGEERDGGIMIRPSRGLSPHHLGLQRFDLELDLPNVASQRTSGDEPQRRNAQQT